MTAMATSRVEPWERRSEVPLLLLAVAFLVAYVWPVLDPVLNRIAGGSLVGRATAYVIGLAVVAVGLGSVAMLDVERGDPEANITPFGDALWWAPCTVTTVGYGDRFP